MTEPDNEYATPEPESSGLEREPTRYSQESVSPPHPVAEPIPPVVEPVTEPEPEVPKKVNKVRRFLRNLLRWILGILIVFGFGFLTAVLVIYRPELLASREQLKQTSIELTSVQEQLVETETTYQNSIAVLEDQVAALQPLADENQSLLAIQNEHQLHTAILDARLDVANAQLALTGGDTALANVILAQTGETLTTISSLMPENQQELVTTMEARLELILSELEEDPFAAQSDLDVLEKALLELEDALFGG
jgi:hypothetical protein